MLVGAVDAVGNIGLAVAGCRGLLVLLATYACERKSTPRTLMAAGYCSHGVSAAASIELTGFTVAGR